MKIWNLKDGDKVRFPKNHTNLNKNDNGVWVDRYPDFCINVANHSGIVQILENYKGVCNIAIKLDKYYKELDEWDNCVWFYGDSNNEDGCIENYNMKALN